MEDQSHTARVYSLIRDGSYREALHVLQGVLALDPSNRAALSLLAYCQYQLEDFEAAAAAYGALADAHPSVAEYQLYHAQSLLRAGLLPEAARAVAIVEGPPDTLALLSATLRYESGDTRGCRTALEPLDPAHPAVAAALGCCLYRERQWVAAAAQFSAALQAGGFSPEVAYGLAACQYQQRDFAGALATIGDIVELGVHEHPELGVGSAADGLEVRTVGNSATLRRTALVEALSLRAAVELQLRNAPAAAASLADMPPRTEAELDPVTLHNQALVGLAAGGKAAEAGSLHKLAHLVLHPPFPPEAVGNLLSLCCRPGSLRPELAEQVLDTQAEAVAAHLAPEAAAFYRACTLRQRAQAECAAQLDAIAGQHVEKLRRLVKQVQDARWAQDQAAAAAGLAEYEATLEALVPVLMSLAGLHWDAGAPARAQEVLQQSAEFCGDHATWRLNLAHTLVAQEGSRLGDAAELFESILQHFAGGSSNSARPAGVAGAAAGEEGCGDAQLPQNAGAAAGGAEAGSILDVPPSAVANLCVCYVILNQNEVAEDLLRRLEDATTAQQQAAAAATAGVAGSAAPLLPPHLSLANLAIGTLYCAKGNYEFGISRVMRALEPLSANLDATRWRGARACLLGMLDAAAKQMLPLKDALVADLLAFLEDVAEAGRGVPVSAGGSSGSMVDGGRSAPTIRSEARAIHAVLLKMCD